MNKRQLLKIGVPERCVKKAMALIQDVVRLENARGKDIKQTIADLVANPDNYLKDELYAVLAVEMVSLRDHVPVEKVPIDLG
ncbi:hypothetical protein Pla110_36950 [Polystyrenella longa]|uniref:Uncharacterized protein n=1 Tax=Polystyrenella longa TaxID=2528007 RepID=A0A518CRU9_9PLAN|nr:hypothetical protein [Polystyrenella longa]QDU81943.1 hypothetical protein Pla110_36950 [Polystyrenella longa]